MFKKIVSNLPYSPALITEVGFYASRLRKEDTTRRVTVLFIALALIMQSLSAFSPPESANASSEQDIIRGGVSDLNDFLIRYDHNEEDVKDIYSTVGVSRAEIAAAQPGTIQSKDNTYVMSRYGQMSASSDERSMPYQRSVGGAGIRYFSPLSGMASSHQTFKGWIGKSASLGWFAIIQASGSLATHGLPKAFSPEGSNSTSAVKLISAENLTQNAPAESVVAKPLDKISYTLRLSNPHIISVSSDFSVRISDLLEYTTLVDGGGGAVDDTTNTLSWPVIQLNPGLFQERTFVVQVLPDLPETAVGAGNPESFDCKLSVVFGNAHTTNIDCPSTKRVEAAFYQLPNIGAGGSLLFISVVLLVILFFTARTRQLKKEIRIIRHNFNTGII